MSAALKNKRTTLVSFSGIDGAGKSTQIQALRSHFEQQGLSVEVIPFWDRIARLTNIREGAGHKIFKGEKGVGSPEAPVNRRDKNVRSWPMSFVRLGLYLLDAFATRDAVRRALHSGTDLVIFDRYMYDELANLNLRNPLMRAYVRFITAVTPQLGASFVLDADPLLARARKPEYPLEFIYINRQSYLDLSGMVKGLTVIPAGTVDEVRANVLRHTMRAAGQIVNSEEDSGGMMLERAS